MTAALQRRLTLLHAVAIGLGSMIGAGVFTAIGLAAALTGGHPGLLYAALAAATLGMLWMIRQAVAPKPQARMLGKAVQG